MRNLKPGFERPVIVHRAILGSVERMFAILCEHTGGKWPFWLSPRQVAILPINDEHVEYANKVANRLVIVLIFLLFFELIRKVLKLKLITKTVL